MYAIATQDFDSVVSSMTPSRTCLLALSLMACAVAPRHASAQGDCIAASADAAEAGRAGRWDDAVRILDASRARPACRHLAAEQTYSLAYALEKLSHDDPPRACEASAMYSEVVALDGDRELVIESREALSRTTAVCNCHPSPGRTPAETEATLRRAIERDACRGRRAALRLMLAEHIEQQAIDAPDRACEAQTLYTSAIAGNRDTRAADRAERGARRMALVCGAAGPTAQEPGGPEPAREPAAGRPDRAWAWTATAGAGALLVGSGVLFALRGGALDDRADAKADYLAAYAVPDPDAAAAAADRHARANDQAQVYDLAGWTTLGLGAALAVTATWLWLDDDDAVTAVVAPGHAAVVVHF